MYVYDVYVFVHMRMQQPCKYTPTVSFVAAAYFFCCCLVLCQCSFLFTAFFF
jgi:hypothetical protein